MDITAIINLHAEGNLANATIRSAIKAVENAYRNHNLECEILLILDNPNIATIQLMDHFNDVDFISYHIVEFKDLGLSRNFGTSKASGQYLTFLDGDDLWGEDWLWRCFNMSESNKNKNIVWHPETNIVFGKEYHLFHHTDMESKEFQLDYLRVNNYWTALSFAPISIYQNTPFNKNEIQNGFGFEDWNWNCKTIAKNVIHKVAINTCHFIRKKENDSMLFETNQNKCLVSPHTLFEFKN